MYKRQQQVQSEKTLFIEHSFDLITVAQALHWFDFNAFYTEANRVLRPGGLLAAWGYELLHISPEADAHVLDFYQNTIGPYWPPERRHVQHRYEDLDFPFKNLPSPDFEMQVSWTLPQLLGYLGTWSAVKAYERAWGHSPLAALAEALAACWPERGFQVVRFPIFMRCSRCLLYTSPSPRD